jgi:hypothetical protein
VEHSRITGLKTAVALHRTRSWGAMPTFSTCAGGRASPRMGFSAYCLQHFVFLEKRQAGIPISHKKKGKSFRSRMDSDIEKTVLRNYNSFFIAGH